jgi:hypothetical protein
VLRTQTELQTKCGSLQTLPVLSDVGPLQELRFDLIEAKRRGLYIRPRLERQR